MTNNHGTDYRGIKQNDQMDFSDIDLAKVIFLSMREQTYLE